MLYQNLQEVTLPVLFDGAYNRTLEGQIVGGLVINVNADRTLDLCIMFVSAANVGVCQRATHYYPWRVELGDCSYINVNILYCVCLVVERGAYLFRRSPGRSKRTKSIIIHRLRSAVSNKVPLLLRSHEPVARHSIASYSEQCW